MNEMSLSVLKHLVITSFLLMFWLVMPAQEQQHTHENGHESQENVSKDTTQTHQDSAAHPEEESLSQGQEQNEGALPEDQSVPGTGESVFRPFSAFPTLHPLVVHFPVVLLLLAFFSQLAALFTKRKVLSSVTLFLLVGGLGGGLLAAFVYHPHVGELPIPIRNLFETHEHYAYYTLWLSGAALLFKLISHFILKLKMWAEIIVFVLILGSTVTVSLAGHLGTQLAYIENVGPGGKYLQEDHEDHEH